MANVSIYDYTDYRRFLRAWFEERDGRPSKRSFAKRVPCSATLITLVLSGERDLTAERAERFCDALQLDEDATRYFLDLVVFDQTDGSLVRQESWERIQISRRFRTANRITDHTYALFARREYAAIAELSRCVGWRDDPAWIGRHLTPPLGAEQVREALEALEEMGLLVRDARGRRVSNPEVWATDHEVEQRAVALGAMKQNQWMLARAAEVLETVPWQERHFSVSVLSFPMDKLDKLRRLISHFQEQAIQLSVGSSDHDRVLGVAVQMFPLTEQTRALTEE